MRLKRSCLKDMGLSTQWAHGHFEQTAFLSLPQFPKNMDTAGSSLDGETMARGQSQGASEALHHLSTLYEDAKLFNCLFSVSAFLSTESSGENEKIGA